MNEPCDGKLDCPCADLPEGAGRKVLHALSELVWVTGNRPIDSDPEWFMAYFHGQESLIYMLAELGKVEIPE